MPIQVGYCNGTNHKLDACEYHRCSELGVAITDLILLLGKLQDVTLEHYYDTDNIQAFFVPAGTVYEMYATTLLNAPGSVEGKTFKNIVYSFSREQCRSGEETTGRRRRSIAFCSKQVADRP